MNVVKKTSLSPIVRRNCTIRSEDDVVLTKSWIVYLASLAVKLVEREGTRYDVSRFVSVYGYYGVQEAQLHNFLYPVIDQDYQTLATGGFRRQQTNAQMERVLA
jgi:hypothetical protein